MPNVLTLNKEGIMVACVLGLLLLLFGSDKGLFFLAVMLWFLVLSAVVTELGRRRKETIGVFEKARGWRNVIANGIIPLFIAALYFFNLRSGVILNSNILIVSYVASVAAITSDKFASELGVLNGKPTMLLTLKKVKQGVSGGVTGLGLIAGILGSLLIGATLITNGQFAFYLEVVAVGAFLGNLADSALGYYEEKGIGNKFTSNIVCAFVGWLVSLVLLIVLL